jgi:hypothetical protein
VRSTPRRHLHQDNISTNNLIYIVIQYFYYCLHNNDQPASQPASQ